MKFFNLLLLALLPVAQLLPLNAHAENGALLATESAVLFASVRSQPQPLENLLLEIPDIQQQWTRDGRAVLHRLAGDDTQAFWGFLPRLEFISSPALHASVSDSGTLYLTTGILEQIHDHSEFAFLLAHEISHVLRGHHRNFNQQHYIPPTVFMEYEIEADRMAVQMITDAGYDPLAASRLLTRLSNFGGETGLALKAVYPGISARIQVLQQLALVAH